MISQQLITNQRYLAARREDSQRRAAPAAAAAAQGKAAGGGVGTAVMQRSWPSIDDVGRVPAVEIMVATSAIRNLIREAKSHQIDTAIQTGGQYGMQTMDSALADLYRRGLVSAEDAIARAIRPEDLKKLI